MLNRILSFVMPPFLRRLDHNLMINYPIVAMSKVHYVALIGILYFAITLLLKQFHYTGSSLLFDLPLLFLAIVWAYQQVPDNPDDQFANHSPRRDLGRIGLYHLCLGIFIALHFWNEYWLHPGHAQERPFVLHLLLATSVSTALLLIYQQCGLKLFFLLVPFQEVIFGCSLLSLCGLSCFVRRKDDKF